MSLENDYGRRLLLLAGDITACEAELAELREILCRHIKDLPEYLKSENKDLTATLERIESEYRQLFHCVKREQNGH